MKVYVSAASLEVDRAERFIAQLRESGHQITEDWTVPVRAAQAGEVVDPKDSALRDLAGVVGADALVVLLPEGESTSKGLWVELGCALTLMIPILLVGDPAGADIWAHLSTIRTVPCEEHAVAALQGWASRAGAVVA